MEIDQRNAGGSVTLNNTNLYTVDRWQAAAIGGSGTGTATAQRVADAPAGFVYSLKYTVTNAKTPAASDNFWIYQPVEGQNIIDFAFGTASAKTITLSFWVKSSLTGTFSGFLRAQTAVPLYRSYVFNYTINSTNTWQYVTVTAAGDTGQVPALDNTCGISVLFDLGSGSNYQTSTLNSWQTGNYYRSTSSTNLISTNGATFQVTGVQLELGSTATPFERRSIGQELAFCQRYYETNYQPGYTPGYNFNETYAWTNSKAWGLNFNASDDAVTAQSIYWKVTKRNSPTVTIYSPNNGTSGQGYRYSGSGGTGNFSLPVTYTTPDHALLTVTLAATGSTTESYFMFTANSEL
jgi:hypothetical protein